MSDHNLITTLLLSDAHPCNLGKYGTFMADAQDNLARHSKARNHKLHCLPTVPDMYSLSIFKLLVASQKIERVL
jgi:hypothetical protein